LTLNTKNQSTIAGYQKADASSMHHHRKLMYIFGISTRLFQVPGNLLPWKSSTGTVLFIVTTEKPIGHIRIFLQASGIPHTDCIGLRQNLRVG